MDTEDELTHPWRYNLLEYAKVLSKEASIVHYFMVDEDYYGQISMDDFYTVNRDAHYCPVCLAMHNLRENLKQCQLQ